MELHELNRMFDQLVPTPEQERDGLNRLLHEERKVSPMKKLRKLTAAGIAAVLMVTTCVAAAAVGLDRKIMDFLNIAPAQEEMISSYAVPVNITEEDHGGTLQVRQMLMDRYTVMILADFTVPDGIELDEVRGFSTMSGSYFLDSGGSTVWPGGNGADWTCVERDAGDRRITLLYVMDLAETGTNEADRFQFVVRDLKSNDGRVLLTGDWSCMIPLPGDSGLEAAMDEVYWTEGTEERVTEVYLSPMTFHVTLNRDVPIDGEMDWSVWQGDLEHFAWLQENIILADRDGNPVELEDKNCMGDPQETNFTFGFPELIDPAQFQGGTLTIEGHVIPLDSLTSVESIIHNPA